MCYFYFVKFYLIYFSNLILTDSIVLEFLSNLTLHLFKELFFIQPSFFEGMQRYAFVLFCQVLFEIFFIPFSNLTAIKLLLISTSMNFSLFPFLKGMQR